MTRQLTPKFPVRSTRSKDVPPKRGLKLMTSRKSPTDPDGDTNANPSGAGLGGTPLATEELQFQELELSVGDQFIVEGCLVQVVAVADGEAKLELVNLQSGKLGDRVTLGEDVRPRQPR